MTTFWILAGGLALAAAAFLLYPLWRDRRGIGRWSATGLAAAVATVPLAVLVYFQVTTYAEPELPPGVTQAQADDIAELAERMQDNPGDVRGWRVLGRSYMALGQYVRARRAFQEAWQRSEVKDNELKLSMAESMIFTERASLGAEAGDLIDEVLGEEPRNQRALWYGGLVAMQRGRDDVAVSRWQTLLETNPPPEMAAELRSQIAALTGRAPPAGSGGEAGSQAAAADGPTIELDVRVGEAVPLGELPAQAALFIFARASDGGPPVAVIRQPVDAVPGAFTLSDANTMLQGSSLADYDELTVVARISTSGSAAEQSGDYFGQAIVSPGDSEPAELVIDQVVP